MKLMVQIEQFAETEWRVTRVSEFEPRVWRYDIIARVVTDGDLHYVELAYFKGKDREWLRQPRGYQILRGALKHASDHALGKVEGS